MNDKFKNIFDDNSDGVVDSLPNLLDIMLVFCVGLISALFLSKSTLLKQKVVKVREKTSLPQEKRPQEKNLESSGGNGYEHIGKIYRDPKTGKLYMVKNQKK